MQLSSASPMLLGALLALALSGPVPAQVPGDGLLALVTERAPAAPPEPASRGSFHFLDARVRVLVAELERLSPTVSQMLDTIRIAGFPLSFGTFADLAEEMQAEYRSWSRGSMSAAGYMAPVVRTGPGFDQPLTTVRINIAINLGMIDEVFASTDTVSAPGIDWSEVRRLETLAVLAHEIVHAYGLAMAGGDPRNGCPDPAPGTRSQDSCVMIGENLVRAEIGAPLDWDYGFPSVTGLADRYVAEAARRARLREVAAYRFPAYNPALPSRR